MSSNYWAGQYNDTFSARRLGNWEVSDKNVGKRPQHKPSDGALNFIANERGHLLPGIAKNTQNSPWGSLLNCCIQDNIIPPYSKNRINYNNEPITTKKKRYPIPSFYKKKAPPAPSERPLAAKNVIDPIRNYLREISIPTLWIMGLASKSVKEVRKKFGKQLAQELLFTYIDLDDQLSKWIKRSETYEQLSNKAESNSTNSTPSFVNYFKLQTDFEPAVDPSFDNANASVSSFPLGKINFNTAISMDTDKILELLKLAMVEALPTHGFIVDAFPCNLQEAAEFEKAFYPAAMGFHFAPSSHRITTPFPLMESRNSTSCSTNTTKSNTANNSKVKVTSNSVPPATIPPDPIIRPRNITRKFISNGKLQVDKLCNTYGHKVIRVMDAEFMDHDTVYFLIDLVRKNLEKYAEMISSNGKVRIEYDLEVRTSSSEGYSEEVIDLDLPAGASSSSEVDKANVKVKGQDDRKIPSRRYASGYGFGIPPGLIRCGDDSASDSMSSVFEEAMDEAYAYSSGGFVTSIQDNLSSDSSYSYTAQVEPFVRRRLSREIPPLNDNRLSGQMNHTFSQNPMLNSSRPNSESDISDQQSSVSEGSTSQETPPTAIKKELPVQDSKLDVGARGDRPYSESESDLMNNDPDLDIFKML